jgi:NADH-quinone oxidoreductase subunit M
VAKAPWIPSLGLEYHLAADGVSLTLVLLTGLAAVGGILFSWNIEHRAKEFFAFYLALIGGVYGVFLSFDLFLLFVFYEIAIVPKYFIIAIWGSTRKEYGAMKLALYSFVGSAMVLIGLIAAYVVSGAHTMNLLELAKYPFPHRLPDVGVPAGVCGLRDSRGHVAVSHLGADRSRGRADRCFDVARGRGDEAGRVWLLARGDDVVPGRIGGVENVDRGAGGDRHRVWRAGGAGAKGFQIRHRLFERESHGLCDAGLMTLNTIGLSGAVLQMFSHGIIAGLLFAVVGRMVYERTHTRELATLEGMNLVKAMPFAAVTFVIAGAASMGLPGFSGFIAELQVIIGAWQAFPTLAVITGVGIVIGVAYTLRAMQKAFFGEESAELQLRR